MKKNILLFFMFVVTIQNLHAQNTSKYGPVRVDIGVGSPVINSSGPKKGFIIYTEPYWNFKMYKVGVRFEGAMGMYMKYEASTVFAVDRFINSQKNTFRPFVGMGVGAYHVSESGGCSSGIFPHETTHTTKPLGAMLRTGFELDNFRLSIEYNAVQRTYVRDYDQGKILIGTQTYTSSYFGFKAGFCIGYKRKK